MPVVSDGTVCVFVVADEPVIFASEFETAFELDAAAIEAVVDAAALVVDEAADAALSLPVVAAALVPVSVALESVGRGAANSLRQRLSW